MSYMSETGETSATYRPSVEVPPLVRRTSSVRFVAPGSVTRGQFGLFEWNMKPKAGGPDPHFHKTFSESFYVMSGTVRLYDGSRWVEATAGDFIYVPMGGIHAFKNDADAPASMLIVFAPGAPREKYFEETAQIATSGRTLTAEEWTELYARHDQYMV
jgi:mannose-6-phosphate isomerase-like protein (cupin superfamily)